MRPYAYNTKHKTCMVMKPHSKSGLKRFFPNAPDMTYKGERKKKRTKRIRKENALRESSLRFARPNSRTSTETVGSSDKRVATTRPAGCARKPELAHRRIVLTPPPITRVCMFGKLAQHERGIVYTPTI